jgi:hypothetical protein
MHVYIIAHTNNPSIPTKCIEFDPDTIGEFGPNHQLDVMVRHESSKKVQSSSKTSIHWKVVTISDPRIAYP